MNVFTLATNDQSIFFLGQIFGMVGTVIPTNGTQPMILGIMFRAFNSVVLSVGALIVVYITVMGVMATAAEGEFLGKKWHSLWVPLRTLLGIAALVPTTTGYSAIQIIVMWVIIQGIGAADFIWGTTINALQVLGSPYAGLTIPSIGVQNTMQTLFKAVTCDVSARSSYPNPMDPFQARTASPGGYFCAAGNPGCGDAPPFNKDASSYPLGPNGKCGVLSYCNKATACASTGSTDPSASGPDSIKCIACNQQLDAIQQTLANFRAIAVKFVQYDYDYSMFYRYSGSGNYSAPAWIQNLCNSKGLNGPTKCCVPSVIPSPFGNNCSGSAENFPNPGREYANPSQDVVNLIWKFALGPDIGSANFTQVNTSNYITSISGAVSAKISSLATSSSTTLSLPRQLQEAKDYGWIYAGAYYYYIAQMNNNNLKDAMPQFEIPDTDPSTVTDGSNPLTNLRNNYKAAGQLVSAAANAAGNSASSLPPALGSLSTELGDAANGIMSGWMNILSGANPGEIAQSPLSKIQAFGNALLITVQIVFAVVVILSLVASVLGYLSVFVLGTGIVNPVGPALSTIYTIMIPVLLAFLAAFFTFGAMLGVYVPLIPYVIFTAGAIGWFISTIEAMVAAPLVALGILSPGGHHEIFGKAEPALMLIFGIFLRPTLMIFGLMAGMLLSSVVVTMINSGFRAVMGNNLAGSSGPLQLILFMAAYVYLIVASLNKCFALIHIVPDRALRWIGGTMEQSDGEVLGEVKSGVGGAAGTAQGASQGVSNMTKQQGDAARSSKGEGLKEAAEKKKPGGPEIK